MIKNKIFSAALFFISFSFFAVPVVYADISITDCTGLQNISLDLTQNYSLSNDIDCSATSGWNAGRGFIPIGDDDDGNLVGTFTGSLDGNGFTIQNLTIVRPTDDFVGLFSEVDGIQLHDFTISGTIEGKSAVGALAGFMTGQNTIDNVISSVNIVGNDVYVGGLVGNGNDTEISNSSVSGTITGSSSYVGGFVGYAFGLSIADSTFRGDITGAGSFIGGFAGSSVGSFINLSITSSDFTSGSITVNTAGDNADYIGGLVGIVDDTEATITESSVSDVTMTITSTAASVNNVGGLVGRFNGTSIIASSNSDIDINISALDGEIGSIGGLVGISEDILSVSLSYVTGDITITTGDGLEKGIGGLIGFSDSLDLEKSYSTGDIDITTTQFSTSAVGVGGLVGKIGSSSLSPINITDCFSAGDINIDSGDTVINVGGFLGSYSNGTLTLSSSYSIRNVSITAVDFIDSIGGFIGTVTATDAEITDSWSAGAVLVTSEIDSISTTAGFIGNYDFVPTLSNNYYDKTTSMQDFCVGESDVDPTSCTTETDPEIFKSNDNDPIFTAWDFSTIWLIDDCDYPVIRGLPSPYSTTCPSPDEDDDDRVRSHAIGGRRPPTSVITEMPSSPINEPRVESPSETPSKPPVEPPSNSKPPVVEPEFETPLAPTSSDQDVPSTPDIPETTVEKTDRKVGLIPLAALILLLLGALFTIVRYYGKPRV